MGNFFVELKRHYLYCVAAAYAVVASVLQASTRAADLKLPYWPAHLFSTQALANAIAACLGVPGLSSC
jgi:hypothetical protein